MTGFANVEEDFADNAVWNMNLLSREKHVMPWRIETEMKRIRRELHPGRGNDSRCRNGHKLLELMLGRDSMRAWIPPVFTNLLFAREPTPQWPSSPGRPGM